MPTQTSTPASQHYRITKPATPRRSNSLQNYSELRRNAQIAHDLHHNLPSPQTEDFSRGRKRKREEGDVSGAVTDQQLLKHRRSTAGATSPARKLISRSAQVEYWRSHNHEWSDLLKETAIMGDNTRPSRPVKRAWHPTFSRSDSQSYRQSTLSGGSPRAWGRRHGQEMEYAGLYMDEKEGVTITEECERLCNTILQADYPLPENWHFQRANFLKILEQVKYQNEARVMRDVTPLVMPSPETLHAQGHHAAKDIAEGLNAEWTKCTSLCGPKSKPDATHGVSRSAFAPEEREKLVFNNICACEDMLFPFCICEVKSVERSIEEAELQAMHNSSVAINAVVELYQNINIGAAQELHGQILAFSISHNHHVVKIFVHFPWVDGSNVTFHRRLLFETNLTSAASEWTRPYQITLGIWEHFYPEHLRRIRDALSRQRSREMESSTAQLGLGEDAASARSTPPSSQGSGQFKRPSVSSITKLEEENDRLRDQILGLTQSQNARQLESMEESRKQHERIMEEFRKQQEMTEQQWAQQTGEARKQKEQMEQQLEEQKEEAQKQKKKMEQQLEEQNEEARKQKKKMEEVMKMEEHKMIEEMKQQRQQMEQQMEQLKEIIALLKESRSSTT